ncbi:hypothetical protein EDC04DRAFT_1489136 [Pisolithus marmoratus]|nr:hypothetical protein EDC04DRAFT_1489136 [Pisolithus marmoratus]
MILCYDYLLTLRKEVDFFWMKPRRSWMFMLFVANRYLTILGRVPAMVSTFWPRHWGEDGTLQNGCCLRRFRDYNCTNHRRKYASYLIEDTALQCDQSSWSYEYMLCT